VQRIGSHCTSGDERSRLVATQITTAELVSQTATMCHPRALLPAFIACNYCVRCICGTQHRPRALLACYPYVLATHHLLPPPPATSAAAACFLKTRPEVARVGRPSWGGSEQSEFGRFGRSLARNTKPPHFTRGINPSRVLGGVTPISFRCCIESNISNLKHQLIP